MPHWEPVEEHDVTDEAHLQVPLGVRALYVLCSCIFCPYHAAYGENTFLKGNLVIESRCFLTSYFALGIWIV